MTFFLSKVLLSPIIVKYLSKILKDLKIKFVTKTKDLNEYDIFICVQLFFIECFSVIALQVHNAVYKPRSHVS
jgi:hypothetical protein